MAPTMTLFPPQARAHPVAFIPGDDGTVILARDARPVRRDDPAAPGGLTPQATTVPAASAVGGQSLDDVLVGAWEGLTAHRSVACPVCRGALRPRYGATSRTPIGGRCDDCGTTLA